jgi:hypothetical protein
VASAYDVRLWEGGGKGERAGVPCHEGLGLRVSGLLLRLLAAWAMSCVGLSIVEGKKGSTEKKGPALAGR